MIRDVYICCIVKNEAPYIEEWVEYHLTRGVDHFFFYEHGSMDNTKQILDNYERLGICTVINWAMYPVPAQRLAYKHCLDFCKLSHPDIWLGFLDADEFVVTDLASISTAFNRLEKPDTGVLAGNWILFGSSGHLTKPPGLVIENYTHSEPPYNLHTKCFCIPERTSGPGNDAHTFLPNPGFAVHLGNGKPAKIGWPFQEMTLSSHPLFYIHHYHTKSKEEYRVRCERGRVDMIEKKEFEINFPHHDRNDIKNETLLPYVGMLKEAINMRRWNFI